MKELIAWIIISVILGIIFVSIVIGTSQSMEKNTTIAEKAIEVRYEKILISKELAIYKYDKETKKYNLVWKDTGEKVE